jgi:hypothetical protein
VRLDHLGTITQSGSPRPPRARANRCLRPVTTSATATMDVEDAANVQPLGRSVNCFQELPLAFGRITGPWRQAHLLSVEFAYAGARPCTWELMRGCTNAPLAPRRKSKHPLGLSHHSTSRSMSLEEHLYSILFHAPDGRSTQETLSLSHDVPFNLEHSNSVLRFWEGGHQVG